MTFINRVQHFTKELQQAPLSLSSNSKAKQNNEVRSKVLTAMFNALRKAPVTCCDTKQALSFTSAVSIYSSLADKKDKKAAEKVAEQIQELVLGVCKKGLIPKTELSTRLDALLNTSVDQLTKEDYKLLSEAASSLAEMRFNLQQFYRLTAYHDCMEKLKKQCVGFEFPYLLIDGKSHISIRTTRSVKFPTDPHMVEVLSRVRRFEGTLSQAVENEMVKEVALAWARETDPALKKTYEDHLLILAFKSLWFDSCTYEQQNLEQHTALKAGATNECFNLFANGILFTDEFIAFSASDEHLVQYAAKTDLGKFSKRTFDMADKSSEVAKIWYKLIYDKIEAYKGLHSEADLPLLSFEKFDETLSFYPTSTLWEIVLDQLFAVKKKARDEAATQKTKPPLPAPTIAETSNTAILPVEEATPVKEEPGVTSVEMQLQQSLNSASPFKADPRILAWYGKESVPQSLNNESCLFHNFGWAANEVLWKEGLRHFRRHDRGYFQPCIAMLCKVEHHLYAKAPIFLITVTFENRFNETANVSTVDFDRNWLCYHRGLTRRIKDNDTIQEYIQLATYQCVDFPPLPDKNSSQAMDTYDFKKVYPDESFIEKVDSSAIIIRDPKHDVGKDLCRLHLYIPHQ